MADDVVCYLIRRFCIIFLTYRSIYRIIGVSGEISHRYSYLADGTKTSVGD